MRRGFANWRGLGLSEVLGLGRIRKGCGAWYGDGDGTTEGFRFRAVSEARILERRIQDGVR